MNDKIKIYSLNVSAVLLLSFTCAYFLTSLIGFVIGTGTQKSFQQNENSRVFKNIQPAVINWDRILNSGFFRMSLISDAGGPVEEYQTAAINPSELKLVGTITGSWEYSRAMVRNRNSAYAEIFKINQNIYGYKLVKINDYSITLKSNGQTYKLEMYGDDEPGAVNPQQINQPSGGRNISRTISRASIQQKIQGNMDNMLRGLRIGPFREGSEITGYTLISVDPSNVLYDIGARSGDVIRRINGHPASSTEKIFELWKSINSESKFIIDIERNKSILTYDINITD
ncbi:MAG: hypothetical protein JW982_13475 [Spirochaetes bacterium]|nr:hypothetical protein [Spirochaetota bacterium]